METTTSNKLHGLNAARAAGDPAPSVPNVPPGPDSRYLPEEPLVVIEPSDSWGVVSVRDVWAYRELLYFLTWRDLKVRYKQTALGVAWVVMQPLLTTIIFTIFLGVLARVPSDRGVAYPVFVYTGLLPWTFFSSAILGSGNSLVGNAQLITKVYFPRLIVPVAAICGRLVDFSVAFLIYVGMAIYYHVPPSVNLLMLPALVALMMLLALGFGMLTSAANVKYRDVGVALPVLIQLWMYVSPVLYPSRLVYERVGHWGWLYWLNPLVGILDNFRAALLGGEFNWYALGVSAAITFVLLAYAAVIFRRVEKNFADVI
ncbi:MAG: ABC transporter permease [Pyrinomonadaceae bacterium]